MVLPQDYINSLTHCHNVVWRRDLDWLRISEDMTCDDIDDIILIGSDNPEADSIRNIVKINML